MNLSDITCKTLLVLMVSLIFVQDTLSCDPVVISGPTTICPGSTNTYTVSGISPSQLDFWSIGAQPGETAVICGFVSVTPLSVSLCVSEGYPTLCVIYDNGCEACINITVLQDPFEDFNGELMVCGGDIETYTLSPTVPNNYTVNYSVTNGTILSSGNSQIEIEWAPNQTSGQVCASVSNCNNNYSICTTVAITPLPTGNPVTLSYCENGSSGQAVFNLTNSEFDIGNGLPVTWFEDVNLTIPIANPGTYLSGSNIIYAQLTQNGCLSQPIPVTLIVTSVDPESYFMNIQEEQLCPLSANQWMPVTVNFILAAPGLYTYQYELICDNGTTTSSVTTANGELNFNVNSSCTLNIISITSLASGCQVNFSPPLTDNFTYNIPPQIDVLPGFNNICAGQTIDLDDFIEVSGGVVSWYSTNPPNSNSLLDSGIITPTTSNNYSAGVEYGGCVYNLSYPVNVIPFIPPFNDSVTVCENAGEINLNQYLFPPSLVGGWSGPGVIGNIFNPMDQSGSINIVFNPVIPCYENNSVNFQIDSLQSPSLENAQICATMLPFDLSNLRDTLFKSGVWTGMGVENNFFNPSPPLGTFSVTFTSSDYCTNPISTSIEVLPNVIPALLDLDICETETTVDLFNLLDSNYPSGAWSGMGVVGNSFYPDSLTGTITLTFIANDQCSLPVNTTITINKQKIPQLQDIALCESSLPLNLSQLADPNFETGNWSGFGVNDNIFYPQALIGTNIVTFISDEECTLPSVSSIIVSDTPEIINLDVICQSDSNFIVKFDIIGSDPNTYFVNGIATPANYISGPFPSNGTYDILLTDVNGCAAIPLQISKKCDCVSNSGTMDFTNAPIINCIKDSIRVNFNNNSTADLDDKLLFVLHENDGLTLGNILAVSDKPIFAFPQNGIPGRTYYVSAMIGNKMTNGSIDFNDPCFSICKGVPVIFYQPAVTLPPKVDLCAASCIDLPVSFVGESPFSLSYEIIQSNGVVLKDTILSREPNSFVSYCPDDLNTTANQISYFKIIAASDKNCEMDTFPTFEIKVNSERNRYIKDKLCLGETFVINGQTYDQFNPNGRQVIPSGNPNQCDSLIIINLEFLPSKVSEINPLLCSNESVIVNKVKYDLTNHVGKEVIKNGAVNGCDSIINVNLRFRPEVIEIINVDICKEDSLFFNGVLFNSSKTEATFILQGTAANGCDSVITFKLNFYENILDTINLVLNKGQSIIINGVNFNEINNRGLTVSTNRTDNGCLKYEFIDIVFKQELISADIIVNDESCPEYNDGSVVINSIAGCTNYKVKINNKIYENVSLPYSIEKLAPDSYLLEIFGDVDCYFSATLDIKASKSQGFELETNVFNIILDKDNTIDLQITPVPSKIAWAPSIFLSCKDCLSPIVSDIYEDTRFAVELTDNVGCIYTKDIFVKVIIEENNIVFPNIFSPNDDGNNDEFVVLNTSSQKVESLSIYDRWGTLIFTKKSERDGLGRLVWDGTFNNQKIVQGVYVYFCSIITNNGKKKTAFGDVFVVD